MNKKLVFVLVLVLIGLGVYLSHTKTKIENELVTYDIINVSDSWLMFMHDIHRTGNLNLKKINFTETDELNTVGSNAPEGERGIVIDKEDTLDPSAIFVDLDRDGRDEIIAFYKNTAYKKEWPVRRWVGFVWAIKFAHADEIEKLQTGSPNYVMLWQYVLPDEMHTSFAASDINNDTYPEILFGCDDGNVYALSHKGEKVEGVHAPQGILIWKFKTDGKVRSTPTIADINNDEKKEIIFGSDDGYLYTLNNKGELLWKFKTNGKVESSPSIFNNRLFFGSDDHYFYALDNKGKLLWRFKTNGKIRSSTLVYDYDDDLEIEIIFGSDDGNIYMLNLDGKEEKKIKTGGRVRSSPAVYENYVVVGSEDGNVYFFNSTSIIRQFIDSPILSTPSTFEGGTVFMTLNGTIIVVSPEKVNVIRDFNSEYNQVINSTISLPIGNINGYPTITGFLAIEQEKREYPQFFILALVFAIPEFLDQPS